METTLGKGNNFSIAKAGLIMYFESGDFEEGEIMKMIKLLVFILLGVVVGILPLLLIIKSPKNVIHCTKEEYRQIKIIHDNNGTSLGKLARKHCNNIKDKQ